MHNVVIFQSSTWQDAAHELVSAAVAFAIVDVIAIVVPAVACGADLEEALEVVRWVDAGEVIGRGEDAGR
jgi:hypothetical protein